MLTKASGIARRVARGDKEGLRNLSYHCIQNAFTGAVFSDDVYGINGSCPAEDLHVVQHGLFTYALEALFGAKRSKKVVRRRKGSGKTQKKQRRRVSVRAPQSDDDDDVEEEAEMEEEEMEEEEMEEEIEVEGGEEVDTRLSRLYQAPHPESLTSHAVFTDSMSREFDDLARKYGRLLQHQSDREWCRAYFPTGVTTNAKKNGHEERCVLMLCLLIFLSKKGEDEYDTLFMGSASVGEKPTHEKGGRLAAFVELLTNLLLYESFLREYSIRKKIIVRFRQFVPFFLEDYKLVIDRQCGMAMNFIKFHINLHGPGDIAKFGVPDSWSGSYGESNHKGYKAAAKRTQQNTASLEKQTATRVSEDKCITRAMAALKPSPVTVPGHATASHGNDGIGSFSFTGKRYRLNRNGVFCCRQRGNVTPVVEWPEESSCMTEVVKKLQGSVLPFISCKEIILYTQLKITDPDQDEQGGFTSSNSRMSSSEGEYSDVEDLYATTANTREREQPVL